MYMKMACLIFRTYSYPHWLAAWSYHTCSTLWPTTQLHNLTSAAEETRLLYSYDW